MVHESPGSFKDLIAQAGGIPVLWVGTVAHRKNLSTLVFEVQEASSLPSDDEQRRAFESTVEAVASLAIAAKKAPDKYSRQMGRNPMGWPVLLQTDFDSKTALPNPPRAIEILTFSNETHLFDVFRSRRGGTPEIENTNTITGRFLGIAQHLWGGKKLLTFDSPKPDTLTVRVDELLALLTTRDMPDIQGLKWFLNEHKDPAAEIPVCPSSKAVIRLVWTFLAIQTKDHPERIPELRRIVGKILPGETDKAIAKRIRKELIRRFSFLKPS